MRRWDLKNFWFQRWRISKRVWQLWSPNQLCRSSSKRNWNYFWRPKRRYQSLAATDSKSLDFLLMVFWTIWSPICFHHSPWDFKRRKQTYHGQLSWFLLLLGLREKRENRRFQTYLYHWGSQQHVHLEVQTFVQQEIFGNLQCRQKLQNLAVQPSKWKVWLLLNTFWSPSLGMGLRFYCWLPILFDGEHRLKD